MSKNPAHRASKPGHNDLNQAAAPAALTSDPASCPCGSGLRYPQCCQPAIRGSAPATTAQALMRSRYSAFALGEVDYLIATTHPDFRRDLTRASLLEHHQQTRWLGLTIISMEAGAASDSQGKVHFIAAYAEQQTGADGALKLGPFGALQENSNFQQIDSRWYYCDGNAEVSPLKPERNAPCPCSSGRKFKRCCG